MELNLEICLVFLSPFTANLWKCSPPPLLSKRFQSLCTLEKKKKGNEIKEK